MSTTATPTLGLVEDAFKALIWDTSLQVGLAALFTYVPVLNVWPLRRVITDVVQFIGDKLFFALRELIDVSAIQLRNAVHQRAFDRAVVTLKIIAHDKGIESPEFMNARENAKIEFSKFVRFGAAA